MPRRRLKHKQIIETIQQDDFQVAMTSVKEYWAKYVAPYEGRFWGGVILLVVLLAGTLWWKSHSRRQLADANLYLAQARSSFESGDVKGALNDLGKVLPSGEYAQPGVSLAADMVAANIAFASGEYDTAIATLTGLVSKVPDNLRADVLYQLAVAQENKGNFEAAMTALEGVVPYLGKEPDLKDLDRKASVWDRYYFQKGRIQLKMNKEDEGNKSLLSVCKKSPWFDDAQREIGWHKARPTEGIALKWQAAPKS